MQRHRVCGNERVELANRGPLISQYGANSPELRRRGVIKRGDFYRLGERIDERVVE